VRVVTVGVIVTATVTLQRNILEFTPNIIVKMVSAGVLEQEKIHIAVSKQEFMKHVVWRRVMTIAWKGGILARYKWVHRLSEWIYHVSVFVFEGKETRDGAMALC